MIALDLVRELLLYEPVMGKFVWKEKRSSRCKKEAGWIDKSTGYRFIEIDGVKCRASHIAWLLMTGKMPDQQVDHKNTIRDDNRWENLRLATRGQNIANSRLRKDNTTGFKGVSWNERQQKFKSSIGVNGGIIHLGWYVSAQEAHEAYLKAAAKYFGEFARGM